MSKTIHMTVRQAYNNQFDDPGNIEFRKAQFEDDIDQCSERRELKKESLARREKRKLSGKQQG